MELKALYLRSHFVYVGIIVAMSRSPTFYVHSSGNHFLCSCLLFFVVDSAGMCFTERLQSVFVSFQMKKTSSVSRMPLRRT